jgi:hypothetical protein
VVAYKFATVVETGPSEFRFKAVGFKETYDVYGVARCQSSLHRAPVHDCTCGFWAMYRADDLAKGVGTWEQPWVLLEVELAGRAEIHDLGLRAEKQTVLSAAFSQGCRVCPEPAVGLGLDKHGVVCAACGEHLDTVTVSTLDLAGALGTQVRIGSPVLTCAPASDSGRTKTSAANKWLTALMVLIAVGSLAAGALFSMYWNNQLSREVADAQAYAHGRSAQARVVNQIQDSSGHWQLQLAYRTDEGRHVTFWTPDLAANRLADGATVEVSYLAGKPQAAHAIKGSGGYQPIYSSDGTSDASWFWRGGDIVVGFLFPLIPGGFTIVMLGLLMD